MRPASSIRLGESNLMAPFSEHLGVSALAQISYDRDQLVLHVRHDRENFR